jgi:hypothetical protein
MSVARTLIRALVPSALALLTACAPPAPPGPGERASQGTNPLDGTVRADLLGVNVDPTNGLANPGGGDLSALGATRVRVELKVRYDGSLSADDELAAALAAYDDVVANVAPAQVLLLLDYATLDQERAGSWGSDSYREAFRARAGAIAQHYAALGVDHFEIWNEEDLCAGDYCPRIEPGPYGALLGAAADAIHDASPGALVALGGLGSGDWEGYLTSVRDAMGDGWSRFDAVGLHPYTHWPKATGRGPNELEYMLSRSADIGRRTLWLTEWGDGGDQAAAIAAYFAFFADGTIAEAADVGEAYLFAWSDAQHDAPDVFGLFDRSGNEKQAEWDAFHAAASAGGGGGTTCGDLAAQNGWANAMCEWNGNGVCGGQGTPTSDCDVCCDGG